ncbi:hypothetical protein AQJ23_02135 [Streptomyces antibioticus]|nr:hypothetical protein AQJ23_02135 [Streptomyces antibioticus]
MPRDVLHQEQIIGAAIALLDEGGIESLTMRRLSSWLGITAAALYWHIKSRHDLLLLAADTVWGQTPLPALDSLEWRPALLAMADNLRSMLLRHPWLLAAMTIQPLDGPARRRDHGVRGSLAFEGQPHDRGDYVHLGTAHVRLSFLAPRRGPLRRPS